MTTTTCRPGQASAPDRPWVLGAACRDTDPELFFPPTGGWWAAKVTPANMPSVLRQALSLCLSCPVRTDCLADALQQHRPYGIWGGVCWTDSGTTADPYGFHAAATRARAAS